MSNYQSHCEVVEEVVGPFGRYSFMVIPTVNFHFIFGLVEDSRWCSQLGCDRLSRVSEPYFPFKLNPSGLQNVWRACHELQPESQCLCSICISQNVAILAVDVTPVAGQRKLGNRCFSSVIATINNHLGKYRWRVPGKAERAQPMTSSRFILKVNREVKTQSTKVKCKELPLLIIHTRSGGSEASVNLIHSWNHIRPVEHCATVKWNKNIFIVLYYSCRHICQLRFITPLNEMDHSLLIQYFSS